MVPAKMWHEEAAQSLRRTLLSTHRVNPAPVVEPQKLAAVAQNALPNLSLPSQVCYLFRGPLIRVLHA